MTTPAIDALVSYILSLHEKMNLIEQKIDLIIRLLERISESTLPE